MAKGKGKKAKHRQPQPRNQPQEASNKAAASRDQASSTAQPPNSSPVKSDAQSPPINKSQPTGPDEQRHATGSNTDKSATPQVQPAAADCPATVVSPQPAGSAPAAEQADRLEIAYSGQVSGRTANGKHPAPAVPDPAKHQSPAQDREAQGPGDDPTRRQLSSPSRAESRASRVNGGGPDRKQAQPASPAKQEGALVGSSVATSTSGEYSLPQDSSQASGLATPFAAGQPVSSAPETAAPTSSQPVASGQADRHARSPSPQKHAQQAAVDGVPSHSRTAQGSQAHADPAPTPTQAHDAAAQPALPSQAPQRAVAAGSVVAADSASASPHAPATKSMAAQDGAKGLDTLHTQEESPTPAGHAGTADSPDELQRSKSEIPVSTDPSHRHASDDGEQANGFHGSAQGSASATGLDGKEGASRAPAYSPPRGPRVTWQDADDTAVPPAAEREPVAEGDDADVGCWTRLKRAAKALKRNVLALYYAAHDPDVGWLPKIIAAIAIGYALSPMDLIPDFIPVLGILDDLLILPGLIWLAIKLIPSEAWQRAKCRADMEPVRLANNWVAAILIFALWDGLGMWAAWALTRHYSNQFWHNHAWIAALAVGGGMAALEAGWVAWQLWAERSSEDRVNVTAEGTFVQPLLADEVGDDDV